MFWFSLKFHRYLLKVNSLPIKISILLIFNLSITAKWMKINEIFFFVNCTIKHNWLTKLWLTKICLFRFISWNIIRNAFILCNNVTNIPLVLMAFWQFKSTRIWVDPYIIPISNFNCKQNSIKFLINLSCGLRKIFSFEKGRQSRLIYFKGFAMAIFFKPIEFQHLFFRHLTSRSNQIRNKGD